MSPLKTPCAPPLRACSITVPGVCPGAGSSQTPVSSSCPSSTSSAWPASITGSTLSAKEPWLGTGRPWASAARCSASQWVYSRRANR